MTEVIDISAGRGRSILLVTAHADDAALFLGGTILRWADAGWRVVCIRATDDRTDSTALSEADTIAANAREFAAAAKALGLHETIDFGYPTDTLGDVKETELRERIIRQIRRVKPYALVTFDPLSRRDEDNLDHIRLAEAVGEAFWTSQFARHHPEHEADGLSPHGCFERWYFARTNDQATHLVDIAAVLPRKIAASLAHETMLRHAVHQLRLQARTGGYVLPPLDAIVSGGDLEPFVTQMLTHRAAASGKAAGLAAAESFRIIRFGGLEGLIQAFGQPI